MTKLVLIMGILFSTTLFAEIKVSPVGENYYIQFAINGGVDTSVSYEFMNTGDTALTFTVNTSSLPAWASIPQPNLILNPGEQGEIVLDLSISSLPADSSYSTGLFMGFTPNSTTGVSHRNLTCTFDIVPPTTPVHKVTVSSTGGGFVSPMGVSSVKSGNKFEFQIFENPAQGILLDSFTVGGTAYYTFKPYRMESFTITQDTDIHVYFGGGASSQAILISTSSNTGGSITPAADAIAYVGWDLPYVIIPDPGYKIESVTVTGPTVNYSAQINSESPYTFWLYDLQEDQTLDVTFASSLPTPIINTINHNQIELGSGYNMVYDLRGKAIHSGSNNILKKGMLPGSSGLFLTPDGKK